MTKQTYNLFCGKVKRGSVKLNLKSLKFFLFFHFIFLSFSLASCDNQGDNNSSKKTYYYELMIIDKYESETVLYDYYDVDIDTASFLMIKRMRNALRRCSNIEYFESNNNLHEEDILDELIHQGFTPKEADYTMNILSARGNHLGRFRYRYSSDYYVFVYVEEE